MTQLAAYQLGQKKLLKKRKDQRTAKRALTAFECFVKGDHFFFDASNHG